MKFLKHSVITLGVCCLTLDQSHTVRKWQRKMRGISGQQTAKECGAGLVNTGNGAMSTGLCKVCSGNDAVARSIILAYYNYLAILSLLGLERL